LAGAAGAFWAETGHAINTPITTAKTNAMFAANNGAKLWAQV
jgi:hypothetical protein